MSIQEREPLILSDKKQNPPYAEGRGNIFTAIFGVTNTAVGAGVLAFPSAYQHVGLLNGVFITLAFVVVVAASLRVVAFSTEMTRARSYQDLIYQVLGQKLSKLCEIVLLLYLIGACIAYMTVIGDMITIVFQKFGGDHWYTSRKFLISAFSFSIMLPLCFLKRVDILSYFSGAAILSCSYLTVFVTVEGIKSFKEHQWDKVEGSIWSYQFLSTLPILCFAFQSHILVPPLYAELKNRSLAKMDLVFFCALMICAFIYIPVGFWGYVEFGKDADGDILNNYPITNIGASIARACISFTVTIAFPLNHFPARTALGSLLGFPQLSNTLFYGITLSLFSFCLGFALFVPGVSVVFSVIGAVLGVWIIFLFPGLLAWNFRAHRRFFTLFAVVFFFFGVFIGLTGTVITIYNLFK